MRGSKKFVAAADHYDRFMGRYTRTLAPAFVDAAGLTAEHAPVLDVGSGPGGMTEVLAERVGGASVAAIDPAEQFVAATQRRVPQADARVGAAEELPWDDDAFGAALSCLVVAFMDDPEQGVREMVRVTRPGGIVAAAMWHLPEGMTMIREFWAAYREAIGEPEGDGVYPGSQAGDLAARLEAAGLQDVHDGMLTVHVDYADFDDYWEPFTFGVGPPGQALAALSPAQRGAVRGACQARLPSGPFRLQATCWYARGIVG